MTKVPKKLNEKDFRFIKLRGQTKMPLEKNWSESNNYSYEEITKWGDKGNNYGVATGYGNLGVIDCDVEILEKRVKDELPETFTVETGSGGKHYYYIIDDLDKKFIFYYKGTVHAGELQWKGQQVVGAGSTHPESGLKYKVVINKPIAHIKKKDLQKLFKEFKKAEDESKKEESKKDYDVHKGYILPITRVVEEVPELQRFIRKGKDLQGAHPVHGSTTKINFCIDDENDLWHCFRCLGKNTQVLTPTGYKNIQDIEEGDLVLGDDFKAKRVYNPLSYNISEVVYSIKINPLDNTIVTFEHPLLINRVQYSGKHLDYSKKKLMWAKPGEINTRRDFLVVPRKFGTERCINGVDINKEVAYLIGYYLGEGHIIHTSQNRVSTQLTLSFYGYNKALKLADIVQKYFTTKVHVYHYTHRGTTLICINDASFTQWIESLCGTGSSNKRLGKLQMLPKEELEYLLKGYFEADGHTRHDGRSKQIHSVSKQLLLDTQQVLYRFGIVSRVSKHKSRKYKDGSIYTLYWTENPKKVTLGYNDKDYTYIKIKSISEEYFDGRVYNIETEGHKYLCPFVTHNCGTGGDTLTLIAMLEGIIKCEDVKPGCLKKKKFKKTIKAAKEKYGFTDEELKIQELPEEPKSLEEVYSVFQKWMYIEDTDPIDLVLATALSSQKKGTPVWMILVGASSGGKSQFIRALSDIPNAMLQDDITPNTLASGAKIKGKKVEDLGMKLQGKSTVVLTSDLASLTSQNKDEKRKIWAKFRELFDGYIKRGTGNGVFIDYKDCHVTWIFGATPTIRSEVLIYAQLGTRELMYELKLPENIDDLIMEKAWDNEDYEEQMKKEMQSVVRKFYKSHKYKTELKVPDSMKEFIKNEAKRLEYMRASAPTDMKTGELITDVSVAKPHRAMKQLKKLYIGLKSLRDDYSDKDAARIIRQVVDSTSDPVRNAMMYLHEENPETEFTVTQYHNKLKLGKRTVKRQAMAMWNMGYLIREDKEMVVAGKQREVPHFKKNPKIGFKFIRTSDL